MVNAIKIPYPPFVISRDRLFNINIDGPQPMTKEEFAILVGGMEDFQRVCTGIDALSGIKGAEFVVGEVGR